MTPNTNMNEGFQADPSSERMQIGKLMKGDRI